MDVRLRLFVAVAASFGLPGFGFACTAITGVDSLTESSDASADTSPRTIVETGVNDTPGDTHATTDAKSDTALVADTAIDSIVSVDVTDAPVGMDTAPSPMITFEQGNGAITTTDSVVTVDFNQSTQAGDLLVVAITFGDTSVTLVQVTDSQGSSFGPPIGPYDGQFIRSYIAYATSAVSGADSIQVKLSAVPSSTDTDIYIHEYAGLAVANAFDVASGATGTSRSTDGMTTGVVTSSANELIFGFGVSGIATTGTGFTTRSTLDDNITEDQVVNQPGIHAATATMAAGNDWVMMAAAFRGP